MGKHQPDSSTSGNSKVKTLSGQPMDLAPVEFAPGELGEIQQILFGRQIQLHQEQFAELQTHIDNRLTQLSVSCQQQISKLASEVSTNIESLKATHAERDQAYEAQLSAIKREHGSLENSMFQKIKENNDKSDNIQQQINTQIEQSKTTFSQSLNSTRAELTKMIEEAVADLQNNKLDRTALSTLLGSVATHLSQGSQSSDGTQIDSAHTSALAPGKSVGNE